MSEIRRATHYGVTPEKQEVDDLRSEVGCLRLQVTDMDGRIDSLSRMVDRLLGERSAGGASLISPGGESIVAAKHEVPPAAGCAKKRRLDGEWDGAPATTAAEHGVVGVAAGAPRVKMEAAQESGAPQARMYGSVRVKDEATESPLYEFPVSTAGAVDSGGNGGGDGIISGGGPLCRESSFLRGLDDISIGSVGSMMSGGSLGPLELIDATGGDVGETGQVGSGGGLDVLNESFFDLDFDAEIISMSGSEPCLDAAQEAPVASGPAPVEIGSDCSNNSSTRAALASGPAPTPAPSAMEGVVVSDQEARLEELTASLDSMPAESRRKLAEGLLALAQNPGVVSTFASGGASGATVAAASVASGSSARPAAAIGGGRGAPAMETPGIAMPLASAALGAFMVHYAQAQAVKDPANAVAAVAMDASRHALERTTSLL